MTFISYAQNNEDVLLWRALGHIGPGFYIDVGANDPVEDSVTKAFYDAGWSGINIEPLPMLHQAFLDARARDTNLALAAGAAEGELTLYDIPAAHGWASAAPAVAEAHRAEGLEVAELTVPVRTLAAICAEHATGDIHFLKVDVEGFEGEVLRGMDFARWRPWVLVVEATLPNSRVCAHGAWEHLVTGQRYRFAWFDGLNRYYVAEEHAELMAAFGVQPNFFDGFIPHRQHAALEGVRYLSQALRATEAQVATVAEALRDTKAQAATVAEALHASKAHGARLARMLRDAETQATESVAKMKAALQRAWRLRDKSESADDRTQSLCDRIEEQARENHEAQTEIETLRAALAKAQLDGHHVSEWARGLEQRLIGVLGSRSWRMTGPWRAAGGLLRTLREPAPGLARRALGRITANERLRRLLLPVLLRHPALRKLVEAKLIAIKHPPPDAASAELRELPVSVRSVLADLLRARSKHTGS